MTDYVEVTTHDIDTGRVHLWRTLKHRPEFYTFSKVISHLDVMKVGLNDPEIFISSDHRLGVTGWRKPND